MSPPRFGPHGRAEVTGRNDEDLANVPACPDGVRVLAENVCPLRAQESRMENEDRLPRLARSLDAVASR